VVKKIYIYLLAFVLPLLPAVALAQGIVPCNPKTVNGKIVNDCGFCQAGQLIKNLSDWVVIVAGVVVVLIIIYAGLKMVLSVGNVSAKSEARKLIATGVIGYIILLASWMIVDVFIKFLIPGSSYGVANPLICS
jgi:hypothetical protein